MNVEAYLTFVLLTSIMLIAPGPAVLFSVRNGLVYGVRRSFAGVCGNAFALFLMVSLTAFGLSHILSLSEVSFKFLKIVGAIYLMYLGLRMWITPVAQVIEDPSARSKAVTDSELFRQGFLLTSSNPKAFAFLSGLLPQSLNVERDLTPQLIVLIPTITLVQVFSFTSYIFVASYASNWLIGRRRLQVINRISGASLIGCGVLMTCAR